MAELAPRGLGRRGGLVLLIIGLLVGGWLYARRSAMPQAAGGHGDGLASVRDAMPADALLAVVVDVAQLRATDVGKSLLGEGRSMAVLGEIQRLCGGDPMDTVEQLGFAVPLDGPDNAFGVSATGAIDAQAMLRCAERIVQEHGGKAERRRVGRFLALRDTSRATPTAELAVAELGPLVLAEAPYLGRALETAAGRAPRLSAEPKHQRLVEAVGSGLVVATVVLSPDQRKTLADELRGQGMADSPFRSVSAAALRLTLEGDIAVRAVLICDTDDACPAVAQLFRDAAAEQARSPAVQAMGLDRLLERLKFRGEGREVHVDATIPVKDALAAVRKIITLRELAKHAQFGVPPLEPSREPPREPPLPASASTGVFVPAAPSGKRKAAPPDTAPPSAP
jgi:hypothetical protein